MRRCLVVLWCAVLGWIGGSCGDGGAVPSIDCSVTAESFLKSHPCVANEDCTAHCRQNCFSGTNAPVFGTLNYTLHSSICKSALHDLRISASNDSARTVTFFITGENDRRSDFRGSVRFNVPSKSHFGNERYFYFTSPRITEDSLDVAMLHRHYIYDSDSGTPTQDCYVPPGYIVDFDYTLKELNLTTKPKPATKNGHYKISLPKDSWPHLRTNMYWCKIRDRMTSDIASPAMFYSEMKTGVPFLPKYYTITVSLNEPLELEVVSRYDGEVTSWVKENGSGRGDRPVVNTTGMKFRRERAQLHDGGLYVVNGPHKQSPGKNRALIRVIVRMCEANKYGPLCERTCPPCKNGGVCHDITGHCICPPGFKDGLCETACGDDRFGRNCQRHCSETRYDKEKKTCKGIMICLPDPYGCSCGTGFKGFFCNETCSPGEYGADCKQERICHCKNDGPCDVFTGTCTEDKGQCFDGWRNFPHCDISYPMLNKEPRLSNIKDTNVAVTWDAWESGNDTGEGIPQAYLLQYKNDAEAHNWITAAEVRSEISQMTYEKVISGLKHDTSYRVRVLVVRDKDKYRSEGVPVAHFKTHCGKPSEEPTSVQTDFSLNGFVKVTWKNPPQSSWNCRSINVTLSYNNNRVAFDLTTQPAVTEYSFPSKPYTSWEIKLRMETPDGALGNWTPPMTVTTAEEEPSAVLNVTAAEIHSRSATIRWLPPEERNGILRAYEYTYQIEKLQQCGKDVKGPLMSGNVTNDTHHVTLTGLKPYAEYVFVIRAFTVKAGNATTLQFKTPEAVPVGEVASLSHKTTREYTEIQWADVPCEQANGVVHRYHVTTRSVDPWETKVYNDTTNNTRVVYDRTNGIVPYTRYNVRVYAENGAGVSHQFARMNFTTLPAEPPQPTSLQAEQKSRTSISLTWEAPYPTHGVIDRYKIEIRSLNRDIALKESTIAANNASCSGTKDPKKQCFSITGLQPDTEYNITVSAGNEGTNLGPPSEATEVEMKELPPGPPTELTATNRTERSIRIEWKEPIDKNGILRQYRLISSLVDSYDEELLDASRPQSAVLPNNQSWWYVLEDLSPGCTYNVCVEASTSAGYGPQECKQVTTKASVPVIEAVPNLGIIVNNTVHLKLSPITFKAGPISNYYVLVVRGYEDYGGTVTPLTYQESREEDLPYYAAARFDPTELKEEHDFVVGDDTVIGGFHNAPLDLTNPYRFGLLVESNFSGDVSYAYRLSELVVVEAAAWIENIGMIAAAAAALLFIIVMFVVAIFYCQKRKQAAVPQGSRKTAVLDLKEAFTDNPASPPMEMTTFVADGNGRQPREASSMSNEDGTVNCPEQSNDILSKPVPVKDLPQYFERSLQCGRLKEEYTSVGRGQLYAWEIASIPENKSKNRYRTILPYDHSRVALPKVSESDSDYINANYVPGYKNPRRYIATQGPKRETLADFWRMVWNETSCKIVMLTNLKENEKVKCDQYWPASREKYGNVTVRTEKVQTYVDFVVRELNVTGEQEGESRQVVQFHFTTWPDHGVPIYPDSMRPFMEHVRQSSHTDPHPIIVHCSGGIGRTGSFILVDSMMDQSAAEGHVDLEKQLLEMREHRINLVESLDQYLFAHQALVEILCTKNRKMSVKELLERIHKHKGTSCGSASDVIEEEFKELNAAHVSSNGTYEGSTSPQNAEKNRTRSILAADERRPFLSVPPDSERTDYINAVYVDGFKWRNAFLVTQFPLPDTVGDFWQMVAMGNARTIVTLDKLDPADESCPQFWPDLKKMDEYYGSNVLHEGTKNMSGVVVRTFRVGQPGKAQRVVRQFHLQDWTRSSVTPPSCDVMLDIIEQVEKWQRQTENKTLIVQCINGCTKSGLYCASSIVCDQLKTEQQLDMFRCVQTIRNSRPQFVRDQAQYEFLYDLALAFLDRFETYANFQ